MVFWGGGSGGWMVVISRKSIRSERPTLILIHRALEAAVHERSSQEGRKEGT